MINHSTSLQVKGEISVEKNNQQVVSKLPLGIHLAQTQEELNKVLTFRKHYYQGERQEISDFHDDGLDHLGYVMYGEAPNNINHIGRLLLDSEIGFPEEHRLPESVKLMRESGKKLAEFGRFVITEEKGKFLRRYYKAIYEIAMIDDIDVVLFVMKKRNVSSHKKIMAVEVLAEKMGFSWDEEQGELCLVAWDMKAKQPKFHKWVNRDENMDTFDKKEWDQYSRYHMGVLVSVQHELYQHVANKVNGDVADLGCGSGRIMGYIQENHHVNSYTGVDLSDDMLKQASWLQRKLEYKEAQLVHSPIEEIQGKFDSLVSIHSFYSWPDQAKTLKHIRDLLTENGTFYLVTPNDNFDVKKLSRMVQREVLGHPYYEEFLAINQAIASKAHYFSLDKLIGIVREAGFCVKVANADFFMGGASYLELGKSL